MELTEREWEVIRAALEKYGEKHAMAHGDNSHGLVSAANRAIAYDLWCRFSFERV